ncbi:MAG: DUF2238 domain-containing protein [Bacteroidetes bacterium]|nr:DUF2238 domain-containing protein [Bacteroidota bacterium]
MPSRRRSKGAAILLLVIAAGLSLIRSPYPQQTLLQHSATLFALVFMGLDLRRGWLTACGFWTFTAFMLLHVIGARWIYSYVPYDDWIQALTGHSLSVAMGWQRNMYDRFVHFCFGLLLIWPAYDLFRHKNNAWQSILLSFLAVNFGSLMYELFEWQLTHLLAPEMAADYNGQQGDLWDAQKDMALALGGSLVSTLILGTVRRIYPLYSG